MVDFSEQGRFAARTLVGKMADEKKNATVTQEFYLPPPQLSNWESFKIFFYNSERGEVMGRNGTSWGKYLILKKCDSKNRILNVRVIPFENIFFRSETSYIYGSLMLTHREMPFAVLYLKKE